MNKIKKLILSSLFLALGMVLPFFTMQIKEIGDTFLPMHLPILLCGFICGWKYGIIVGLILPFFRSLCFGMPPIYPNAVWMSAELAAYGFISGFLFNKLKTNNLICKIYTSLIVSMIGGRIIWGITKYFLLLYKGKAFTLPMFIAGAFFDAWPGIVIQLIIIPIVIKITIRSKINL